MGDACNEVLTGGRSRVGQGRGGGQHPHERGARGNLGGESAVHDLPDRIGHARERDERSHLGAAHASGPQHRERGAQGHNIELQTQRRARESRPGRNELRF